MDHCSGVNEYDSVNQLKSSESSFKPFRTDLLTRSSAVAEGPRDVHVIVKFSYVVTEYV